MLRIVLIRSGATDFDEQGRIKGTLDVPLNARGANEILSEVPEIAPLGITVLYSSPCQAAQETAQVIAKRLGLKVRTVEQLDNLDHGLWHGLMVDEVRQRQPRVYRQLQDHPETVCPPEGEPLVEARHRVADALERLLRKHSQGTIAIVVPEPLCSLVRACLERTELGDLWKAECECGGWHVLDVNSSVLAESR